MKFSVIVPIYNVSKYLCQCIDSILSQSFTDFELILVDDGSTDNSGSICDEYAFDNRVVVIHKQNGGLVSARKAGANRARGEYILNVDGDDYVGDNFLKAINDAIVVNNPDLLMWGYKTDLELNKEIYNSCAAKLYIGDDSEKLRGTYLYDSKSKRYNAGNIIFSIWTKAAKREIYLKCQNQVSDNIVQGEDTILTFLLLLEAKSIQSINYAGYIYRVSNTTSIMNVVTNKDFIKLNTLADSLLTFDSLKTYQNQINVYLFNNFTRLLLKHSNSMKYKSFKKAMHEVIKIGLLKKCILLDKQNLPIKQKILLFLYKRRLWFIFYLISVCKHRKNV